ncbi:hypothetical protein INR49_023634 [Caranx melampygus]|nr:hypothetical protein INR49_023634 [Caranx melampygus]
MQQSPGEALRLLNATLLTSLHLCENVLLRAPNNVTCPHMYAPLDRSPPPPRGASLCQQVTALLTGGEECLPEADHRTSSHSVAAGVLHQ